MLEHAILELERKISAGRGKSRSLLGMCEERQGVPCGSSRVNNGKARSEQYGWG